MLRKVICGVLFILVLSTHATAIEIVPTVVAPLVNFQSARIDGYGIEFHNGRMSLAYLGAFYNSHNSSDSDLLVLGPGWVKQQRLTTWEMGFLVWGDSSLGLRLVVNHARKLGWAIYMERIYEDLLFMRLGFRHVAILESVDAVVLSFGLRLGQIIKKGVN